MRFRNLICLIVVFAAMGAANADIATFEDLNLPAESYWNGSDGSGGFTSESVHLSNSYNAEWGSWDGFSYSNATDTTAQGLAAQYNAITGAGQGGSANYAVGYVGWALPPAVTLSSPGVVDGLYVTNCNYAYYAMLDGDAFSKKFGGGSGDDPDFFLLTITGKDAGGAATGTVDFYLADYRSADNSADYIVDTWQYVDLTSLGVVGSLEFTLSSSDVGDWGMNTPAYFAVDTIVVRPAIDPSGPYTEVGINGYTDPGNDWGHADPQDPNAVINPIFRGWATEVVSYQPAPGLAGQWSDPSMALGPATGSNIDIVSLGHLNQEQISQGLPPGQITLLFSDPIRQGRGYDFVVFENGFVSSADWSDGLFAGQMFAELAYVEVSSNGTDFVRFPVVSLTPEAVGRYGTIEIGNVYNLAGKHPNANGICTGTPFDLKEIADDPDVASGLVDVNDIKYVRIVDIPGSGDFHDEAAMHIDPGTWPVWDFYADNHPIYDAWDASTAPDPSGGFDLEAIGVLREQEYSADIDLNGIVDVLDFELFISVLDSHFGGPVWIDRCDLAEPKDMVIDILDFGVLVDQWNKTEQWRL
ncbi:MAG: hypothetical protein CEE38_10280 [Planctomycetes bacterium B3_Pla]|nr:MAG: hypothetical protein CEE38_10280 [Planctomycetes bacterium B3_Pla]